jgi:hypothetical protein
VDCIVNKRMVCARINKQHEMTTAHALGKGTKRTGGEVQRSAGVERANPVRPRVRVCTRAQRRRAVPLAHIVAIRVVSKGAE